MKVLVVGCGGQLQASLMQHLASRGRPCAALEVSRLEDPRALLRGLATGPSIVVEVASIEALSGEGRQAWPDAACQELIAACAELSLPLMLASHACVFSGEDRQRMRESDTPRPRTDTGRSFLARERALADLVPRHLLLRTGLVFSDIADNPLTALLGRMRAGGELLLSADVRLAPTPAADVARVLSGMIDQLACGAECWGTYHYHAADVTTCYEFAETVLAAAAQYWSLGTDTVRLGVSDQAPCGLPAPLLNCQRIRDHFGVQQRPWRLAIPGLLRRIYEGERQ